MSERSIARIAEAARRVRAGVRASHPSIPRRQIVGTGSGIRHDQDEIDDLVMCAATEDLLPLKAAVEPMLRDRDAD
jgi:uncharacterized protein with HEPN domain